MTSLFINGQWLAGSGTEFSSLNPTTGEAVWTGGAASPEQVETAVTAARAASTEWSLLGFEARTEIVRRYGKLLEQWGRVVKGRPRAILIAAAGTALALAWLIKRQRR